MKRKISKPVFFFLSRSPSGASCRTPRTRRSRTGLKSISGEEESDEDCDGEGPQQHPAAVSQRQEGGRRPRTRTVDVKRLTGTDQCPTNNLIIAVYSLLTRYIDFVLNIEWIVSFNPFIRNLTTTLTCFELKCSLEWGANLQPFLNDIIDFVNPIINTSTIPVHFSAQDRWIQQWIEL